MGDAAGLLQPSGAGAGDLYADMHVPEAERCSPVLRVAGSDVAEHDAAGGHPLAKLIGERRERVRRHAEGLESAVGEGDVESERSGRLPVSRGGDLRKHGAQRPFDRFRVVDPEQHVDAVIDIGSATQQRPLDVVEIQGRDGARLLPAHPCAASSSWSKACATRRPLVMSRGERSGFGEPYHKPDST